MQYDFSLKPVCVSRDEIAHKIESKVQSIFLLGYFHLNVLRVKLPDE